MKHIPYANYMQNNAPIASTIYSTEKKTDRFILMKILNSSLLTTQTLKTCDSLLPHNAFHRM